MCSSPLWLLRCRRALLFFSEISGDGVKPEGKKKHRVQTDALLAKNASNHTPPLCLDIGGSLQNEPSSKRKHLP